MRKSWESHEKVIRLCWENNDKVMRKSWESPKKVIGNHKKVMRKSWRQFSTANKGADRLTLSGQLQTVADQSRHVWDTEWMRSWMGNSMTIIACLSDKGHGKKNLFYWFNLFLSQKGVSQTDIQRHSGRRRSIFCLIYDTQSTFTLNRLVQNNRVHLAPETIQINPYQNYVWSSSDFSGQFFLHAWPGIGSVLLNGQTNFCHEKRLTNMNSGETKTNRCTYTVVKLSLDLWCHAPTIF